MGFKIAPLYYGHVAGREYNVGDIVVLNDHEKSTNGTDVIIRTLWVCVKEHVSSSNVMEEGCWALLAKDDESKEVKADENGFIL